MEFFSTATLIAPVFDPVAIWLGPFPIRWYALSYLAGILLGKYYIEKIMLKRAPGKFTAENLNDMLLWVVIGIILGGRLGHVIFYYPAHYLENPNEILMVWQGGMSFHGGIIGAFFGLFFYTKKIKKPLLPLCDMALTAAPIGLFFGRLANFINGELWGRPSDLPWAMVFKRADDLPRHPSQLYEAGLEGIAIGVLLFIIMRFSFVSKNQPWQGLQMQGLQMPGLQMPGLQMPGLQMQGLQMPGLLSGSFLCLYAIARSIVETVRAEEILVDQLPLSLTWGQILSLPMFIIGSTLIVRALRHGKVNVA